MDLQTKVKDHLKRYGIKKIYLAALIGIYPSQLSEWLSGNYELADEQIDVIEKFLKNET